MTAAVSRQGGNTLSSVTCAYDANGNQISETDSILGTNTTYTYDPAGQLTQAVKSENNVQTLLQENRYDGEGQRIQKTVQAQSPGNITQTTRNYHYQNGEVLYTDDGSVTDAFQVLGAAENVISTIRPEGSGYAWYLYSDDIRGSISSLTDESGDIAAAYEYDELGEIEALTGANFDNELCYTGQIRDKETGLYYCNARYYDPTIGRFLTQDTYRGEQTEPQTLHLYTYCANDPVNHVDPSGHDYIYLNSSLGAGGLGHAALLIRHKHKWRYYSWEGDGYLSEHAQLKVVKKGTKRKRVIKKVNKAKNVMRPKKKTYDSYIFINNNSKASYKFAKEIKRGEHYKKYDPQLRNCAWVAIDILRHGSIGKTRKKTLHNLLFYYNPYTGKNERRIVGPNKVLFSVATAFGTKIQDIQDK